tara:strand:+ start:24784 stop:24927 length:144 start_codon:yes stop_codon:yes gene_type:complete
MIVVKKIDGTIVVFLVQMNGTFTTRLMVMSFKEVFKRYNHWKQENQA